MAGEPHMITDPSQQSVRHSDYKYTTIFATILVMSQADNSNKKGTNLESTTFRRVTALKCSLISDSQKDSFMTSSEML